MLRNPAPFIGYFLACWILFSVLFTVSDESFVYGTLPYVIETTEGAFANLPTSIWSLFEAVSLIVEEIVSEFAYYYPICLIFGIPLALIFAYREARSGLHGIATERKTWMQWSDRQQLVKAEQGIYQTPPLSEYIPGDSYFISACKTVRSMFRNVTLLTGYFVVWMCYYAIGTAYSIWHKRFCSNASRNRCLPHYIHARIELQRGEKPPKRNRNRETHLDKVVPPAKRSDYARKSIWKSAIIGKHGRLFLFRRNSRKPAVHGA